jgi:hypothetical protein
LPIANGGTGSTTASGARTSLGAASDTHTHAGTDITSGLIAAGRLGSSASATTVLHGDQTFSAVALGSEISGTLPVANGGTGSTTASGARTNLGAASDTHTHPAADITSGTITPARLGTGASATTVLHGDSTFSLVALSTETSGTLGITRGGTGATTAAAALAALGGVDASHTHPASDITSGTIAAARLGTGASATTVLHGDQTFSAVALSTETTGTLGVTRGGTGATTAAGARTNLGITDVTITNAADTRIVVFGASEALEGNTGFTYNGNVNIPSGGGVKCGASSTWELGSYTAGGDAASTGYVEVVVGGTTRRFMIRS